MSRGPGNLSDKLDRQAFHEYLWNHRGRGRQMMFSVTELAATFGVTLTSMSRILREMREAGRLSKRQKRYFVEDPEPFSWDS